MKKIDEWKNNGGYYSRDKHELWNHFMQSARGISGAYRLSPNWWYFINICDIPIHLKLIREKDGVQIDSHIVQPDERYQIHRMYLKKDVNVWAGEYKKPLFLLTEL